MKIKTVLLRSVLISLLTAPLASATPDLADLEARIARGSLRSDRSLLDAAIAELDAALADDAKSPGLLYLRGFAEYAAATCGRATSDKAAIAAHFEKAVQLLTSVRGDDAWAGEAAGLAGSICGQLIGLKGGSTGMTLGPKSEDLLAQAIKTAPTSPRILYFRGVSKSFTPVQWGGDPTEGRKLLQQAVDRFAQANALPASGPRWGHPEALAMLGLVALRAGDPVAARAAWEQALELEPDYGMVKFDMMPSLPAADSDSPGRSK